ncbi:SAM-dependent methyltransferase [Methanolobus profundi]|uniref:tRNA-Thr(GGU) m(6)t(6)A37 methyltransferase TsaA n=1 Tax=Methanolobus profundi TaxID=487685 RepID=A0A1I4U9R3_9EURY|nr:SAM-dependent methyltransferase [Methanolobus profundi]SFM85591.1 tRNA-Thr(GGU) m(6)t(6)A37 methyltransferase TsaA [Methanolobus profundi]
MPEFDENIMMHPIGYIQNEISEPGPIRDKEDLESLIVVNDEYAEGLYRIGELERLQVMFFFSLSRGFDMVQRRRYDGETVGVFASRSPNRPNGIGVTVVELLGVEGNTLRVKGLDAINNTPVLDIKPYLE